MPKKKVTTKKATIKKKSTTKKKPKFKVEIKPSKEGTFTEYCKRKGYKGVTTECIQQGLKSKSPAIRKKANFARNVRKWKKTGPKGS